MGWWGACWKVRRTGFDKSVADPRKQHPRGVQAHRNPQDRGSAEQPILPVQPAHVGFVFGFVINPHGRASWGASMESDLANRRQAVARQSWGVY
jgi:hypothetical protein